MKVALVNYQFSENQGGVERYVFQLARRLLEDGHEVHVFASSFDPKAALAVVPRPVATSSWLGYRKIAQFASASAAMLEQETFDIVHGFGRTSFQDVYRFGGGCHLEYLKQRHPSLENPLWRALRLLNPRDRTFLELEQQTFRQGSYRKIFCISHRCLRELHEYYGVPKEDAEVLYNPVDLERFHPRNRERGLALRRSLGISPEEPVAVFVGSGFERKGLEFLIRALAQVNPAARLRLLVVGRGSIEHHEKLAGWLGLRSRVHFLGQRDDAEVCLSAGDLFVFPTLYEPFGTVCLEAMASGLPVIVSESAGAAEVQVPGETGVLLKNPRDPAEIARAMETLHDRFRRQKMGDGARKVAERFGLESHYQKVLATYQAVRNEKARLSVRGAVSEPSTRDWQWTAFEPIDEQDRKSIAERLPGIVSGACLEEIRRRKNRLSGFLPFPSGNIVFAKVFFVHSHENRLRSWLGVSQGQREWRNLRKLWQSGLPVPKPLAFLTAPDRDGTEILLTEAFRGTISAAGWLRERLAAGLPSPKEMMPLLGSVASALSALERTSFLHRDLHVGNLLVPVKLQTGKQAPPAWITDVGRGNFLPRPTGFRALFHLAQVGHSLQRFLPRTATLRLARLLDNGQGRDAWRSTRRKLAALIALRFRRYLRDRLRRTVKSGSRFEVSRQGEWRIRRNRDFPAGEVHDLLRRILAGRLPPPLKNGDGRKLYRVPAVAGGAVIVKAEKISPLALLLGAGPFRSKSRKAWIAAEALRLLGIPSARAYCWMERSGGPLEGGQSYLGIEELGEAVPLDRFVESAFGGQASGTGATRNLTWKKAFLSALAEYLAGLHRREALHRDLKANNLLVAPQAGPTTSRGGGGAGGAFRFYLVDLDRLRWGTRPTLRQKCFALAQLNASLPQTLTRADRLRFFNAYCHLDRLGHERRKTLQRIMTMTIARKHRWPPVQQKNEKSKAKSEK